MLRKKRTLQKDKFAKYKNLQTASYKNTIVSYFKRQCFVVNDEPGISSKCKIAECDDQVAPVHSLNSVNTQVQKCEVLDVDCHESSASHLLTPLLDVKNVKVILSPANAVICESALTVKHRKISHDHWNGSVRCDDIVTSTCNDALCSNGILNHESNFIMNGNTTRSMIGIDEHHHASSLLTDELLEKKFNNSCGDVVNVPDGDLWKSYYKTASESSHDLLSHDIDKALTNNQASGLGSYMSSTETFEFENNTSNVCVKYADNSHDIPYYFENFNYVINAIFNDEFYKHLFDVGDHKAIEVYKSLSGDELHDLSTMLALLPADNLRTMANVYHVRRSANSKRQIISDLILKSQQTTVATFFGKSSSVGVRAMVKKTRSMMGPVYRLRQKSRSVFSRAVILSSLVDTLNDNNAGRGKSNLFQMLLVKVGKVIYPTYSLIRATPIFTCRQDVVGFEESLDLESQFLSSTHIKDWNAAREISLNVRQLCDNMLADSDTIEHISGLPQYLRVYTSGSVLVRMLSLTIDVLQRLKDYTAAVSLARQLLSQHLFCCAQRGYWWDRLALNIDVHLKEPSNALDAIAEGLADSDVMTGHRLSLFQRAEAICCKPRSPYFDRMSEFSHDQLLNLPQVYVTGLVLSHSIPGVRYQFVRDPSLSGGNVDDVTLCNVEQIALDHYHTVGYPQGIHGEGSVLLTLFSLYFWDVLYADVDDAFHGQFQTAPLDLHTDQFYLRRQNRIDDCLQHIRESTEEVLCNMLKDIWEKHYGKLCYYCSWDKFTINVLQDLVTCLGGNILAGMLQRLVRHPRHTRGGFPDLTVWNKHTHKLKFSEVKGPGDRLSQKQILWLDFLLRRGVDAEVCYVKPVGMKKLKRKNKFDV